MPRLCATFPTRSEKCGWRDTHQRASVFHLNWKSMSYSADSAALGARWARLSILFRVPYVVIESDPDIVETLRSRGILCLFGDAIHERRRPITGSPEMELVFTSYIERLNATTRLH